MPNPKKTESDLQEEHRHFWILSRDREQENCQCGKIRISRIEYERRQAEWDNYYELLRTTDAFQDFLEMREAHHQKNKAKMKEIDDRIMQRNHMGLNDMGEPTLIRNDESTLLPKPMFPEPARSTLYIFAS